MRITKKYIAAGAASLALVGTGTGVALAMTGGGNGTLPPAQVLQADGYPVMMTLDADQIGQFGQFGSTDTSLVKAYVKEAAVGMKDGKVEIVMQLTDEGKSSAEPQLATIGDSTPGATAHFDGNDLTMVAPAGSLNGSDQAPAQGNEGYDTYPGMP